MMKKLYKLTMLLIILILSTNLIAVDYYVDPTGTDDGSHGSGTGTDAWATIEYAVNNVANPTSATIVIYVAAGTYNLWGGSSTNPIEIDRAFTDLTIQGAGEGSTYVEGHTTAGSANSLVFDITGADETVTLKNMTIRNGNYSQSGGGIQNNFATLYLTNCTVSGNTSSNGGGGIYNKGNLDMTNCTVSGNTVSGSAKGGGIENTYSTGILTMTDCTISENTTETNGAGGGIHNYDGTITMTDCTVSGNDGGWGAGGIYNWQGTGTSTITMTNCTVSGNDATDASWSIGGGIYNYKGTTTLTNCTLSGNDASWTDASAGGGYYLDNGTLIIKNTIIANNTYGGGNSDYYYNSGTLTDNGYNLVEITNVGAGSDGFSNGTNNDIVGEQGNLNLSATLADNNTINETQTLALSSGSVAINAGTATGDPETDQRGAFREDATDIGAYEYHAAGWMGWTGSSSTAWVTTTNWSSGSMPTTEDVSIPGSLSVYPVVSGSTTRTANSLNIESGASLTIEDDGKLTVSGDLTNSGTFTLQSTSSGTGSLITEGTATGDVTVQRYIVGWTTGTDGWHHLSTPVAAQDIQPNFVPNTPTVNEDFYSWEESSGDWINSKSSPGTWNTGFEDDFVVGKGYLVAYGSSSVVSHDFSGTLNNSDVSVSGLDNTPASEFTGWNLIGNPYQSALYWNKTTWDLNNISSIAKQWVESNASYQEIASTTGIIPAMQGFMVYVDNVAGGSLTIDATDRTHNIQNWYKDTEINKIRLMVYDPEGSTAQESIIRIKPEATTGFDNEYDSYFLAGYAPMLYSATTEGALSTNSLPEITAQTTIPMSFIKNNSSTFYIEAEGVNNLESQETVYLTDLKTNHTQILNDNNRYDFNSDDGDVIQRFVIHFSPLSINDIIHSEQINVFAADKKVKIRSNKPIDAQIFVYNNAGQLIAKSQLNNESSTSLNVEGYKGAAIVSIITSGKTITEKVIVW